MSCACRLLLLLGITACKPSIGAYMPTALCDYPGNVCGEEGIGVIWVFEEEDCLRCQEFPAAIRQAQSIVGRETIEFGAIGVGTHDVPWLDEFFAAERLTPRVRHVSRLWYWTEFGFSGLPRLFLIRRGCVVAVAEESDTLSADEIVRAVVEQDDTSYGAACRGGSSNLSS